MVKKNYKPKYIITYQCLNCGFDFALTEKEKPKCFYCESTENYIVIKKEKFTPQAVANRLKISTDRMMESLKGA